MAVDLHLHTFFSDGSYSPHELVCSAKKAGISCISVTDHDTIDGLLECREAAINAGLGWISGLELTAEFHSHEVHVLGYGIRAAEFFLERLRQFQRARMQRICRIIERLNRLGVGLRLDQVLSCVKGPSPGRPHVAWALVREGFCSTYEEAFAKYLRSGGPCWVPRPRISFDEAVELIRGAGGVAVLAHPGLLCSERTVLALIERGVDGIECFHPKHSDAQADRYRRVATERGLLVTGGSDCHGKTQGSPTLGQVRIDHSYWNLLAERVIERGGEVIWPS